MSNLDINTPRGQKAMEIQHRVMDKLCNKHGLVFADLGTTDKGSGFLYKDDNPIRVYKFSSRNVTLAQLSKWGSWLVTANKLMACIRISKTREIPFTGFLYLIPDDKLLSWAITDKLGKLLFEYRIENTTTRRSINGGNATRANAFLPIDKATEVEFDVFDDVAKTKPEQNLLFS